MTDRTLQLFLGIDVGTQGARAIIVGETGEVVGEAASHFPPQDVGPKLPEGWFEQPAEMWWEAAREAVKACLVQLYQFGGAPRHIRALSVTSTSGTILALDDDFRPLGAAIMYNDQRSGPQADRVNEASRELADKLGYRFNASFGLPKLVWLKEERSELFTRARLIAHAADYILGRLCGEFGVTDYSTALKTGYDLVDDAWPTFISDVLGIPRKALPVVLAPGTVVGRVSREGAAETGLAPSTQVVLGMTDGCTSQIASGAVRLGAWNSTIGTTLVVKGVTSCRLYDPKGRIYCHRHPDCFWMPGGASNVGGDCLARRFKREELPDLDRAIRGRGPSGLIVYPLEKRGERFPLNDPHFEGFVVGMPLDRSELYQGYLEGVGYVERLAYEVLTGLGAEVGEVLYVAGGATNSREWLQIRANILGKTLRKPTVTGAHMGAAILAASQTAWGSLSEAADHMVRIDTEIVPDQALVAAYAERYGDFLSEMRRWGYLDGGEV